MSTSRQIRRTFTERAPTAATPLRRHIAPVVRAADGIDYLIRQEVVPPEDTSPPCIPLRINPPPQSAWLLAIGRGLKLQYDEALAAPIPPRVAALLAQLEAEDTRSLRVG